MTILRWVLVTALAVAFLLLAVANWTPVPFRLPDGSMVNIRLPLLLAAAFVAGWLPTWLIHVGTKATLNRKLAKAKIAEPSSAPSMPSQAQPTIVPPAGA
jgi:uncharacterized integral membrane protein